MRFQTKIDLKIIRTLQKDTHTGFADSEGNCGAQHPHCSQRNRHHRGLMVSAAMIVKLAEEPAGRDLHQRRSEESKLTILTIIAAEAPRMS